MTHLFPVLPAQGPARAVAVHLSGGVLIAQYVIAHDGEYTCVERKISSQILTFAAWGSRWEVLDYYEAGTMRWY